MTSAATQTPDETIHIDDMKTHCDGGVGASGHPRIYLRLDSETHEAVCPYCSRRFILKAGATTHASH